MPESERAILAKWQATLDQLTAENQDTLLRLAASGVMPDPASVLADRIECLAEAVAEAMGPQQAPHFRLLYQVRWQQRMKAKIEGLETEARKAALASGARLSRDQVDSMARQSGLFVPGRDR